MDIMDGDYYEDDYGSSYDGLRNHRQCNQQRNQLYHSGCLGCARRKRYGDHYCDGCQFKKPDWNLPDLCGTERDYQWEVRKLRDQTAREHPYMSHIGGPADAEPEYKTTMRRHTPIPKSKTYRKIPNTRSDRPVRPPRHEKGCVDMVMDSNKFWSEAFTNIGTVIVKESKKAYDEIVKWFNT